MPFWHRIQFFILEFMTRIIFIIIVLRSTILSGQIPTFSKTFHLKNDLTGAAVFEEPDGYRVFCEAYGGGSCYGFLKLNFDGGLQESHIFDPPDSLLFYSEHSPLSFQKENGEYVICGDFRVRDTFIRNIGLIKYNPIFPDSVDTKIYEGSQWDEARSIQHTKDGGYLIFGQRSILTVIDNRTYQTDIKLLLIRTDSMGNLIDEYVIPDTAKFAMAGSMQLLPNDKILITYAQEDRDLLIPDHYILSLLDTNYQSIWKEEFEVSPGNNFVPDITILNDSLIVIGSKAEYREFPGSIWVGSVRVFGYDLLGNRLWTQALPSTDRSIFNLYSLKTSNDGNILGCGWHVNSLINEGANGTPRMFSLSPSGEVLWDRDYWLELGPNIENFFLNASQTSDGGYIAVGNFIDLNNRQDGHFDDILVVKTDSMGCVRTDCDDLVYVSTNEHSDSENKSILLYPNPTKNTLSIKLPTPPNNTKALIFNTLGHLVQKETLVTKESSVDVSTLKSGIYFLKINLDGKEEIKRFVISR